MSTTDKKTVKRSRGRPRKNVDKSQEVVKKPKLTLAQKQALKLKKQREKEAAKHARGEDVPANKDRFYCTNKDLQAELIKWRDSAEKPEDRIISEELGKMMIILYQLLKIQSDSYRIWPCFQVSYIK